MSEIFSNTGKTGEAQYALRGAEYISDTATHTVTCYGFLALADTVIESITIDPAVPVTGNALTNIPVPGGVFLPYHFTAIKLASGVGAALKK